MDTVAQIMTTNVHTSRLNDVIGPVRDLMLAQHIGCVPVLDVDGAVRGIITSTDLVEEWAPQMGVATVMTADVLTVPPHRSVVEAARQMVMRHAHHLVVTERETVVGVVSSFDVMMMLVGRAEEAPMPTANTSGLRADVGDILVVRGGHIGDRDRRGGHRGRARRGRRPAVHGAMARRRRRAPTPLLPRQRRIHRAADGFVRRTVRA